LKSLRLKNHRKFCVLSDLCRLVGWSHKDIVEKLEEKRRLRCKAYQAKKVEKANIKRKADNLPEIKKLKEKLAVYGHWEKNVWFAYISINIKI